MSKNVLHTTLLLQALIAMLHDEGIDINTSAALNIEKVLFNTDLNEFDTFSKLKYRIVPIISRNKEEQAILYKIFDRLDERMKKEETSIIEPIGASATPSGEAGIKTKKPAKWKRVVKLKYGIAAITFIALVIIATVYIVIPRKTIDTPSARFLTNELDFVVNDTINFRSVLYNEKPTNYHLQWQFPDTIINDRWEVTKIIPNAKQILIKTILTDKDGNVVDTTSYSYPVVCEKTPDVIIEKFPAELVGRNWPGKGAAYVGMIMNASKDSANYIYNWLINDVKAEPEPGQDKRVLTTTNKYNENIKLIVTWKPGTHCSTDSIGAQLNDQPAISAVVTGDNDLKITSSNNWKNISLSMLALLLLPMLASFVAYKLFWKKPTKPKTVEEDEIKDEGPYSINFKNNNDAIHPEFEIGKLADVLRKRQISHVHKLNIRRTIYNTVRSGGLPQLAYTPVTKASDYLVFIEKGNPDSHLSRLFEHLLERLRKDQVNLDVYEYQKEPLYLTNDKLNHQRIPVDKMAALYPDRTLFIFGDTRHFVLSLKGKLKDWVTAKLGAWKTKIIVTPYPKNDWDIKETLLTDANFVVIPADLQSGPIVEAVVNGQIDIPSQSRFVVESTYPARFINFQDFDDLKKYLNDENLLKWVCALAIYTSTDWNLTLAIGKAMEKEMQIKSKPVELVTYTNLLKLGRISWMEEGMIGDSIRVQMLNYLDNETEALARQTLVEELDTLKDKILPGSLLKRQFDVQEKVNSFLVDTYRNEKPGKENIAFVKEVIAKDHLDEALNIYLKNGKDTLVKHPTKKGNTISIEKYFGVVDRAKKVLAYSVAAGVFIALFVAGLFTLQSQTSLLQWKQVQPSKQTFVFAHPGVELSDLFLSISVGDSVKATSIRDTVVLENYIFDTSRLENFSIKNGETKLLSQDSIPFNSSTYTVLLTRPTIVPVIIYYDTETDQTIANLIRDNLPPNFEITMQQENFTDTSTNIYYTNDSLSKDAALTKTILGGLLKKDIPVANKIKVYRKGLGARLLANQEKKSIVIFAVGPQTCTPISANAMPATLTEIWRSEANSRMMNIDLSSNIIYYGTGDKAAYNAYEISEVCLLKSGAYKIVCKTNNGYSFFIVRNINALNFELAVCPQNFATPNELQGVDESFCGSFYRMSLYYDNVRSQIYLPVKSGSLPISEQAKLSLLEEQVIKLSKENTIRYSVSFYRNEKFIRSNNLPDQYLSNIKNYGMRTNATSQQTVLAPNPFQRNYFSISFQAVPNNSPVTDYTPNCKKTFYSIDETAKEQSPLIICMLDLSGSRLTTIPGQVYTFSNLRELNLGSNNIPEAEIIKLKRALPKCNIKIQPVIDDKKQEILLGTIRLDEKGYPSTESMDLIQTIARQIANNYERKIRLEASYISKEQLSILTNGIKTLKDVFAKYGVSPSYNQISETVTGGSILPARKSTQAAKNNSTSPIATGSIKVYGINFPPPAMAN